MYGVATFPQSDLQNPVADPILLWRQAVIIDFWSKKPLIPCNLTKTILVVQKQFNSKVAFEWK